MAADTVRIALEKQGRITAEKKRIGNKEKVKRAMILFEGKREGKMDEKEELEKVCFYQAQKTCARTKKRLRIPRMGLRKRTTAQRRPELRKKTKGRDRSTSVQGQRVHRSIHFLRRNTSFMYLDSVVGRNKRECVGKSVFFAGMTGNIMSWTAPLRISALRLQK